MDCHNVTPRFSDLRDDRLSGGELAEVQQHLADCLTCAQEWAEFQKAIETLRSLGAAQPSRGFAGRIRAQIDSRPWYRRLARWLFVPWQAKLPLEAAALILLAVGSVYLYHRLPGMRQVVEEPRLQPPAAPIVASRRPVLPKVKPEVRMGEWAQSERDEAQFTGKTLRPRVEDARVEAETDVAKQVGPTPAEQPSAPPDPSPALSMEARDKSPDASEQEGQLQDRLEIKPIGGSAAVQPAPRLSPTPVRILTLRTTEVDAAEKRIGEWIQQTGGRLLDQPTTGSPTAADQRTLSLYIPVRAIPAFDALLAELGQVFGKELEAPSSTEALISLTISRSSTLPFPGVQ